MKNWKSYFSSKYFPNIKFYIDTQFIAWQRRCMVFLKLCMRWNWWPFYYLRTWPNLIMRAMFKSDNCVGKYNHIVNYIVGMWTFLVCEWLSSSSYQSWKGKHQICKTNLGIVRGNETLGKKNSWKHPSTKLQC